MQPNKPKQPNKATAIAAFATLEELVRYVNRSNPLTSIHLTKSRTLMGCPPAIYADMLYLCWHAECALFLWMNEFIFNDIIIIINLLGTIR